MTIFGVKRGSAAGHYNGAVERLSDAVWLKILGHLRDDYASLRSMCFVNRQCRQLCTQNAVVWATVHKLIITIKDSTLNDANADALSGRYRPRSGSYNIRKLLHIKQISTSSNHNSPEGKRRTPKLGHIARPHSLDRASKRCLPLSPAIGLVANGGQQSSDTSEPGSPCALTATLNGIAHHNLQAFYSELQFFVRHCQQQTTDLSISIGCKARQRRTELAALANDVLDALNQSSVRPVDLQLCIADHTAKGKPALCEQENMRLLHNKLNQLVAGNGSDLQRVHLNTAAWAVGASTALVHSCEQLETVSVWDTCLGPEDTLRLLRHNSRLQQLSLNTELYPSHILTVLQRPGALQLFECVLSKDWPADTDAQPQPQPPIAPADDSCIQAVHLCLNEFNDQNKNWRHWAQLFGRLLLCCPRLTKFYLAIKMGAFEAELCLLWLSIRTLVAQAFGAALELDAPADHEGTTEPDSNVFAGVRDIVLVLRLNDDCAQLAQEVIGDFKMVMSGQRWLLMRDVDCQVVDHGVGDVRVVYCTPQRQLTVWLRCCRVSNCPLKHDETMQQRPCVFTNFAPSQSGLDSAKMIDLHQLIEDYAWAHYQDLDSIKKVKSEFRNMERDDVTFEINIKRLIVEHGEPEYANLNPTGSKPCTLFKTVFTNNTNRDQEYSFKTERTTESVALICREQGYSFGVETELGLKTPCEILEFKAGFKHELTFNKATENSVAEILTWGVDSNIIVPAKYKTTAEMIVEEMKYSGSFSMTSTMYGHVTVSLIRRRDGALVLPMAGLNVATMFREVLRSGNCSKALKQMLTVENNQVRLHTKGSCSFQFAMKQHIQLHEHRIHDENGLKE